LNEDLITKQQVDQWYKFDNIGEPSNCLSVLLTEDINRAASRLE
jgi:hypothetical protein